MTDPILSKEFYHRPALTVARDLIGKKIVRLIDGGILSGMICETEAYTGPQDTACHASKGKTSRNEVMYGPPGRAYVYLVYGLHHMLNFVTERPGYPAAVLIRGIIPLAGIEMMVRLRGRDTHISDGPGKLCSALAIDRDFNGMDITGGQTLYVADYKETAREDITITPRIGIDYAEPEDRDALYRFCLSDRRFASQVSSI